MSAEKARFPKAVPRDGSEPVQGRLSEDQMKVKPVIVSSNCASFEMGSLLPRVLRIVTMFAEVADTDKLYL